MNSVSSSQASASEKHSEYSIELHGNVIRVEGSGIITESILRQYHQHVKQVVDNLNGQPWGFLGFAGGVGVMTPEAETYLVASIKFRKSLGMCACAMITSDATIPELVRNQFERVYEEAEIAYQFCQDERTAIEWLGTQGCHLMGGD